MNIALRVHVLRSIWLEYVGTVVATSAQRRPRKRTRGGKTSRNTARLDSIYLNWNAAAGIKNNESTGIVVNYETTVLQMRKAKEHRVEGIEREGHTHDRAKEFAPTKLSVVSCSHYAFYIILSENFLSF